MMSAFYFVRHADAEWLPDENRPLSTQGLEDAARVADILARFPIQAVYSSPYRRARQTISPLASQLDLPLRIEPDLRERKLGEISGQDFFAAVAANWRDPYFAHPGGESNADSQRRGAAVIERLRAGHPAGQIAISTHGNLMALILGSYDPSIDYAFWKSLTMPDIYVIDFSAHGVAGFHRLWDEMI